MAEFDFEREPREGEDLLERQERCSKAIKTVAKAIFMRLLITGLLIFIVVKTAFIDHINTIKTDNRIENLKWVTAHENTQNPITLQRIKDACTEDEI